jgi:hypothetical protein
VRLRRADALAAGLGRNVPGGSVAARWPVAVGIAVTAGIVLAGTAAQLINYGFALDVPALDSSSDGGAFGVIGDIALASAALAAWIVLARTRVRHAAIVALPVLLTFLALDKALRLHDEIPNWPQYYVPVLLATFAALVLVGQRLSPQCRRLIVIALALLSASFLIYLTGESMLDKLGLAGDGWARQLKAVIKHGAEVAGWLIVSLALLAARVRRPVAGAKSEACYV